MTISPSSKRFLPWLFVLMAAVSVCGSLYLFRESDMKWEVALTLVGASAAFVHFLYTRHLEETRMFRELFTDFNKRYDAMNESLNEICTRASSQDLTAPDCRKLFDYFNLCAEEYYFYRCGYIPEEVWTSWRRGMDMFLKQSTAVKELLVSELRTESYYGLSLSEIQKN